MESQWFSFFKKPDSGLVYFCPVCTKDPDKPVNSGFIPLYPKGADWFMRLTSGQIVRVSGSPKKNVAGSLFTFVSVTSVKIGTSGEDSVVRDSSDVMDIAWSGELTAAITTTGAGGLQTSSFEAADTWYEIHVIADTTGANVPAALLIPTGTAFSESGYDVSTLVGWVRNNGSSDFISFDCFGKGNERIYFFTTETSTRVVLAGGNANGEPATAVDCSSLIPPIGKAFALFGLAQNGAPSVFLRQSGTGVNTVTLTRAQIIAGLFVTDSSQQIFYTNSTPAGDVDITVRGFHFTI